MKVAILICLFVLTFSLYSAVGENGCIYGEKVSAFPFYVYTDGDSAANNFFASGFMGDYNDLRVSLFSKDDPYLGKSCIKVTYAGEAKQGGRWAGLYWQYPANNWGDKPGGYDLRGAKRLTFWARGKKGGEVINAFQVGGIEGRYPDTAMQNISPVTLTKEWKKYTVDLTGLPMNINHDKNAPCREMEPLGRIVGGFAFTANIDVNQEKIVFYLDEIRFEKE